RVIQAICELVNGSVEGLTPGSREFVFRPGTPATLSHYDWDIGSAGSTTMLAIGVLPVLAFASRPVTVTIHGGIFQDFAPSVFHLRHVLLPLLGRMGLQVDVQMVRPGYVPKGDGILELAVTPGSHVLRSVVLRDRGTVSRV